MLLEVGSLYKYYWFREIHLEGNVESYWAVKKRKRKKRTTNLRIRDAWIIWQTKTGNIGGSGFHGCGEVIPGVDTRAYPLCCLFSRETGRLSSNPSGLQADAERAWLWLLHGLCPGERRILWGAHSSLWGGSSLHSQAWRGQTAPCTHQRTGCVHCRPGPRYLKFNNFLS